jgi:DNA-directed RNA polymerase specialized sigma24 family protein
MAVTSLSPRSNYTLQEVEGLVEGYEEWQEITHRLWVLVRLCDLDIALTKQKQRRPKEYQAVLLVGLIGLDTRTVGTALRVSHDTVWRRYRTGLEWLANYLNGATT